MYIKLNNKQVNVSTIYHCIKGWRNVNRGERKEETRWYVNYLNVNSCNQYFLTYNKYKTMIKVYLFLTSQYVLN